MRTLLEDLKYGVRLLAKAPAFTAVALLSLTLGIGANTSIFTLAKAFFLESVPVKDPSRVVSLFSNAQSRKGPPQLYLPTPYPNAVDYREKTDVFSGSSIAIFNGFKAVISGKQQQLFGELVNGNFFDVLGVQPFLGRGFSAEEDASARPVAVISFALWNTQFGADRNVLGRTIQLSQQDFTIIGVAPREFRNVGSLGSPDIWIPISMRDLVLDGQLKEFLYERGFRMVAMVARLKPGVTLKQAQLAVQALGYQLEKEYPKDNGGRNEMLVPINETAIPPQLHSVFSRAGALMMLIVSLVLLIACANVANLLLARATQRQREIAVRLAMGAGRIRLIRQLLTESLVLALLAAAFGILFGYWGKTALISLLPPFFARNLNLRLDGKVLLYTLILAVVATILFGLIPALQASKTDRIAALKDRTGAPTGSTRWYGLRGILVMVQVALSLIALAGAGLFIHSLRNAQRIDPGFEVKHELVMFVNLGAENYAQPQAEAFYRDVVERLKGLPVVAAASIADTPPFGGGLQRTTFTDGVDFTDPRNGKLTPIVAVAPSYFSTAGITLLSGRAFDEQDDEKGAMVAVVNRALAENFWPGQDPLGKHLHFLGEPWDVTVVGEANTVKYATLGEPPQAIVYMPLKQHFSPFVTLYVRANGDPEKVLGTVRSTVQALIPSVPLTNVQTVGQVLVQSLTAPRVGAELLGTFGLLALILASIGTYGVMSYSVSQRTQEIGIRMSLGAQSRDVLRLILAGGLAMVCAGVVFGLGISTLLSRSISSLLFGIGAFDAPSFLGTAALLILVAMAACWIPARRAMRVDPVIALRYE
ncbi:MAG TPA: ABC transporter permease [Candidatus Methylomirabilis sp.]|nr:ABC transporter permease [Candidatus Methylomirabilis sp.]